MVLLAGQSNSKIQKVGKKKFQGKPGKFYDAQAGVSNFKFKVLFSISNFSMGISKLAEHALILLIIQNDLGKTGWQNSKLNLISC